ncbi:hypothetical protein CcaverHIS002_0502230 [Cutaneotrichosporon cavernicola]|uniref:Uncharacterized protein n=1 Tax=Cutaneotrichosporon cavernicola TaxID=279322 RepID=A0AA48L675_9TREE|nr:uncharacterized protein CcaverHIS019_0502810 [Cutaneotrichosporon cavernicola]BEI84822.1 hypothetical protein CcaverHIS002_0502230 [Cutaneotrichosporon cavernicola]BEI92653.1 hypothetical protein CcaverHIS019_0502810 [Cutaneotrichosporon cavernicola]BEJ00428.1 hypothetical protein CcaverHIS631_0502850 [Cutaneotrichosporon cavernicola]
MAYYPSMPAPYYGPYAYPQAYPQVQPMAGVPTAGMVSMGVPIAPMAGVPMVQPQQYYYSPAYSQYQRYAGYPGYDPYMGTTPVAYEPCLATQVTAPAYYQPYMGATQYGSDAWWPHDRNPDQWYSNDRNGVYRPVRRFRDLLVRILS